MDSARAGMGLEKSPEQLALQRQTSTAQLQQGEGAAAVNATNQFGFKLLTDLAARSAGENVFVSPASVALSLGMAFNGAEGDTAKEMASALGVVREGLDKANASFKTLAEFMESPSANVELTIANSIWASDQVRFRQDFLDRGRQVFDAEIRTMSFKDPSAAANINDWVSRTTNGKIDKLIDEVPEDAVMYLINAIYFRGMWKHQFNKELTHEADFYVTEGKSKRTSFMRNAASYGYIKTVDYESVSLPYGDGRLSMLVVLPTKGKSLSDFARALDEKTIGPMIATLKTQEGTVILPKFRSTYKATLNDSLRDMGMHSAFDLNRADFKGMTRDARLYISRVLHKTFVEVNEVGTEAAAVTGTEMSVTSAPAGEPFVFRADRPFFYAIRDGQTGLILFAGLMYSPSL